MTTVDREAHFNKLRGIYREKCDLMCSYIDNGFSKKISYTKPEGGLFIWCTLPESCDMNAFCTKAVQEYKVAVVPGDSFSIQLGRGQPLLPPKVFYTYQRSDKKGHGYPRPHDKGNARLIKEKNTLKG